MGDKRRDLILIMLFFVILTGPYILDSFIGTDQTSNEKRILMEKPKFDISKINEYTSEYDRYYNDNFPLRNELIRINNSISVNAFNTSPIEKVTIGKNGWLYYSISGEENPMALYRGLNLFTETELETINKNLTEQRDWLKKQGIPFILVIAPNKASIYPENIPDNIKKVHEKTRLDQLIEYLKNNSQIEIVDLRDCLKSEKNNQRLYHKTDTHWNSYGAFIAYQSIMKQVSKHFPQINIKAIEDCTITTEIGDGGDLANMLAMGHMFKEERIILNLKDMEAKDCQIDMLLSLGVIKTTNDDTFPSLFMFRDSFSSGMIPYLSESFNDSIYNWNHSFDSELIKQAKPDIVIHEIVERYAHHLLLENPKEIQSREFED